MSIISGTFLKIKKADKSEFPRPSEVLAVSIDQNYTVTDLGNSEFQFITDSGDEYVIQGTDLDTLVAELEASSVESSGGSPEVVRTTWPTVDGNPGDFLQTNGAGITAWVAAGGGSQDLQSVLNEGSSATLSGAGASIFDLTVGSLTQTEFTVNSNGIVVDDGDLSPLSPQGAGTINAVGLFVNGVAVGGTPNLQAVLNEGSIATLSGATFRVESNTTIELDTSASLILGDVGAGGQSITIDSSGDTITFSDNANTNDWLIYDSGTEILTFNSNSGHVFGSATGGAQGAGSINAEAIYIDGVALSASGGGDLPVTDITDHAQNLSLTARGFYIVGAPSANTGLVLADSNSIDTVIKVLNDRSSGVNSLVAAEGTSTINDGAAGETVVVVGTAGAGKQVACFKKVAAGRWISWLENLAVPVVPE